MTIAIVKIQLYFLSSSIAGEHKTTEFLYLINYHSIELTFFYRQCFYFNNLTWFLNQLILIFCVIFQRERKNDFWIKFAIKFARIKIAEIYKFDKLKGFVDGSNTSAAQLKQSNARLQSPKLIPKRR